MSSVKAQAEKAKESVESAVKRGKQPAPIPTFTVGDYSSFFLAGALCATVTHAAMTPIDVVKTRIQIDPAMKGKNMVAAGRSIILNEGPAGLLTGFGPTAVGYLVQGGGKFAGYEFWKGQFVHLIGSQEEAVKYRMPIYLGAAAVGEFFADILLTPLEATRIRLVSDPKYASGLVSGFAKLAAEGGISQMYSGFLPIIFKQIPYALGQFTVNEWCHEVIYRQMTEEQLRNMTGTTKLGINLASGLTAGVAAAVLSQPADTLLSQINRGHGPTGTMLHRLSVLAREAGVRGLFAGLGPRIVMTAGLVSGQFLIYDAIKHALGAPPGIEIHKE